MRFAATANWLAGAGGVDLGLVQRFADYVEFEAGEGHLDAIVLLGNMVDGTDIPPDALTRTHEWEKVWKPLKALAERFETVYLPGVTDAFMYDRADEFAELLAPIRINTAGSTLVPPDVGRAFSVTHGWQTTFWPAPRERAVRMPTWNPRTWSWQPALETPAAAALAADEIRANIREQHDRLLKQSPAFNLVGVVHGGPEPYWGRFGDIWAGCPGGSDYLLVVDAEDPLASGLVHLA